MIFDEIQEFVTGERPVPRIDRVLTTVLFTDVVASTERVSGTWRPSLETASRPTPRLIRTQLQRFHGREVDTAGDGFFATFDGPARAVRCAQAITETVGSIGLVVRAGVHTGEIELMDAAVGGIAVHVGARISTLADPSEVLVSSTVKDLTAGSGLVLEDAGEHELKGVPDRWRLYRLVT